MWIALFFAWSLGAYGCLNVFFHSWVRSELAGVSGMSNNREESDNLTALGALLVGLLQSIRHPHRIRSPACPITAKNRTTSPH